MRLFRLCGPFLALAVLAPAQAGSGARDIRIDLVTAPTPPAISLDRATLRDIFLKRIVIDNVGKALVPLNLPPDDPLRTAFSRALLGKAPDALQRFWNERYFQGVSPPYVVRSQEAMLRFVAETPGAIGYVASCLADERVRVVAELPVRPDLAPGVDALCQGTSRRGGNRRGRSRIPRSGANRAGDGVTAARPALIRAAASCGTGEMSVPPRTPRGASSFHPIDCALRSRSPSRRRAVWERFESGSAPGSRSAHHLT